MCCCGKPVIDGQPGYRWQPNDAPSVRAVDPPPLGEGETLLYDEPGRCGGIDAHGYHFRIVREKYGALALLVRHGAGDERILLGSTRRQLETPLAALDSNGRFWLLSAMYHMQEDAARAARSRADSRWSQAAREGRIKTRKRRNRDMVDVWIELPVAEFEGAQ